MSITKTAEILTELVNTNKRNKIASEIVKEAGRRWLDDNQLTKLSKAFKPVKKK